MLNLLLITKRKDQHYVLIKDFNKFMYNQTKHTRRKHFCMHCLQCFKSEIVLNNHTENCIMINGVQTMQTTIRDQKFHSLFYADFEAINEKVHGC